jgi:RNA polymerase sigma factor (sigma-70 family)
MGYAESGQPAGPGRSDEDLLELVRSRPREDPGRQAACEALVRRYQGIVRSCARRYRAGPELAEDLMQVGYVGLMKAINNFDPAIGGSLAAYAQPCVSGEIKRYFRDKRWDLRVRRASKSCGCGSAWPTASWPSSYPVPAESLPRNPGSRSAKGPYRLPGHCRMRRAGRSQPPGRGPGHCSAEKPGAASRRPAQASSAAAPSRCP